MKSQIKVSFAAALCSLSLALVLVGCGPRGTSQNSIPTSASQGAPPEVTIGGWLCLTGSGAEWGHSGQDGMNLAVEEINAAGGVKGAKLKVVYEDTQAEPKAAVSAMRKLLNSNTIPAVVGDYISSNVLAAAPILEENKVVLISPGASNPKITDAGEYIFRNWPSDALQGVVNAQFAQQNLKWKRVAILYINNAYGTGLRDVFQKQFAQRGGQIVATEAFAQGATDFRTQLTKVKSAKPDGIYLLAYPKEAPLLLKQAKELGVNTRILGTETLDDPKIVSIARNAAEGIVYTVPKPSDKNVKIVKDFLTNYKKKYGKEPGIGADTAYDAVKMLAWAMEQGGFTGPEIQKQLLELKNYEGASGVTTLDQNGDAIKPFILKTVKAGKLVAYAQQPT